jgi:hypothetical protein
MIVTMIGVAKAGLSLAQINTYLFSSRIQKAESLRLMETNKCEIHKKMLFVMEIRLPPISLNRLMYRKEP